MNFEFQHFRILENNFWNSNATILKKNLLYSYKQKLKKAIYWDNSFGFFI